jgi:CRISPR/Cas system type I-B associated protein Csh2 (Cas7 group RAMP superfamily)
MGDSLYVDTSQLERSSSSFQRLGTRMHHIFGQLSTAIDTAGPCWGDDETGRQFAEQYEKPAGQIHLAVRDVGQVFSGTSEGLTVMVRGFTATEAHNVHNAGGGRR